MYALSAATLRGLAYLHLESVGILVSTSPFPLVTLGSSPIRVSVVCLKVVFVTTRAIQLRMQPLFPGSTYNSLNLHLHLSSASTRCSYTPQRPNQRTSSPRPQ